MAKPLSPKMRRFVAEYMKDQNGTQAAIRAGYSKRTANEQAVRILAHPEVHKRIEQKLQKYEVTAERVIAELGRLAFSDLRQLYAPDGQLKPQAEWPEDIARAVAGVEQEEIFEWDNEAKERKNIGDLRKVKLWSKNHALETLAKHFKLLTDKVEHSGSVTLEQLVAGQPEKAA